MNKNYIVRITEKKQRYLLKPMTALEAIKTFNFCSGSFNLLKNVCGLICVEVFRIGETTPKRVLI